MIDFLNFANPSQARLDAIAADAMEQVRIDAGEPLARLIDNVVTQDEASGLLIAGQRVTEIGYDGSQSVGDVVPEVETSPAERLAATQDRIARLVIERRDAAIAQGAPTEVGVMDTSPDSRNLINGAVSMASLANMAGQPFEIVMMLKDRTPVTLNGKQMVEAGVAVGMFIAAAYAPASALEREVRDATTPEAALAIARREGLIDA